MMKAFQPNKEDGEVRRGPWTLEEDNLLIQYIARHGEGRWNALAKSAGLKRTGKSCRLRWLNYLKPDIKRGNLTPQEQLTILELHSKWGNRWSKIAQHLPGRTDNEIKNYWRTRVQKQAKQLNMESNSQGFIDAIKCFYMPRLIQKIEQNSISSILMDNYHQASSSSTSPLETTTTSIDQSYMDYSRSSASAPSFYSSESAKVMNPIEIATYPSYQSDGYNNYQGGSQSKDNSVLSSSKWYYVENCNNEMQEVPAISAEGQCSDVHLANHDWINSDMGGDMWNLDGVWPW